MILSVLEDTNRVNPTWVCSQKFTGRSRFSDLILIVDKLCIIGPISRSECLRKIPEIHYN